MGPFNKVLRTGMLKLILFCGIFPLVVEGGGLEGRYVETIDGIPWRIDGNTIEIEDVSGIAEDCLKTVRIPSRVAGIPVRTVGGGLSGCTRLRHLVISEGITNISLRAFANCDHLRQVDFPSSLANVGRSAFFGCYEIEELTFPGGLRRIGGFAFSGCTALKRIVFSEGLCSISSGAFSGCLSLVDFKFPDSLKSIGDQAFESCISLHSVMLPPHLSSVGRSVFSRCVSLTRCEFPPGLRNISYGMFEDCPSLRRLVLPSSLTNICGRAFFRCSSLRDCHLPEGIRELGESCFENNTALETLAIPASLEKIGDGVLRGCMRMTSFSIHPSNETFRISEEGEFLDRAGNLYFVLGEGETRVLSDEVVKICSGAFSAQQKIRSLTLPSTTLGVEEGVFTACSSLENIIVAKGNTAYQSAEGLLLTKNGRTLVRVPCARQEIDIPHPVTTISKYAFAQCARLTAITIPWSVSYVDEYAFLNCVSLKKILIASENLLLSRGAFLGCSKLKDVEFSSDLSRLELRHGVFQGCESLEQISFPMGLVEIPPLTFSGCAKLKRLRLPEKILAREGDALKDGLPEGCELDSIPANWGWK